jgi:large subunit ribosomal protein L25
MDLQIALDARAAHGKANRRLRRQGLVPAVVFGKGEGSTPVQVDAREFETLYRAAGRTQVIQLKVPGDGDGAAKSAMIKSVQRHPLTGRAIHVDFYVVDLKIEMEVDLPLVFSGEAPAVEATGGTLVHNLGSIRVRALPNDIPTQVEVNVSTLVSLDVAIHVKDLNLNRDKVQVLTDGEELVAKVLPPRIEEEPEVPEEELEAEGELPEGELPEGEEAPEGGEPATGEGGNKREGESES